MHCHVLFQLFFYERGTILQQQLEVSKSSSILYFLYFEIISQHLLLGFPLKCSIDIRTSKNFLFCTANLILVQGDCSIGCFQGSTSQFSTPVALNKKLLAFSCDLCTMQFSRVYLFYIGPQLILKKKIEEPLEEYSFLFFVWFV